MTVTEKAWNEYLRKLRVVNKKAYDSIAEWTLKHEVGQFANKYEYTQALIEYAYAIVTKYGEASSELACIMYDNMAELSNVNVPPAMPAPTATYGETAKSVYGAMTEPNENAIPNAISRLTKIPAQDTILHNAIRDGAEFAWVPSGDTCAFCRMLASNGWRRASKKALKNGHAEHIHANCDCSYAVRFNQNTNIAGYDPDALYEDYIQVGGLRGLERRVYAENKTVINARRRAAYAKRTQKSDVFNTVSDIEEKMREQDWFIHAEINGADWRSDSALDLKNADIQSAKTIYHAYNNTFNDYPQLIGKFSAPNVVKIIPGSMAETALGYGNPQVSFSSTYYKNFNKLSKYVEDQVNRGVNPIGCENPISIAYHEIGHCIDEILTNGRYGQKGVKKFSSSIRAKALKKAGISLGDIRNEVSDYATTNVDEWFAECWAEYKTSKSPRKCARIVGKMTEDAISKLQ